MSVEKVVKVKVVVDGEEQIDGLATGLEKVGKNQKDVADSSKKASVGLKDVGENGGAIAVLDSLTGGLATKIRDAAEASKLFNFSLKGMRTALIATGIGALVVALGLVVAYWDDIVDFITGANKALERQRELLEINAKLFDAQIDAINAEKKLRESQGLSTDQLILKEKALLKARIANRKEILRTRKEELKLAIQRFDEITTGEDILQFFGIDARTQEDLDKINQLKQAAFEAKTDLLKTQKALQDVENAEFDANAVIIGGDKKPETSSSKRDKVKGIGEVLTAEEQQALLDKKSQQFEEIFDLEKMQQDALNDSSLAAINEFQNSKALLDAKQTEEERKQSEARQELARIEAEGKVELLFLVSDALQVAGDLAGKETAAGKALSVASTLVSTYLAAQQAYASQLTIPSPDAPIRAALAAGVAIASGLANVKAILAVKVPNQGGGGGAPSGGGGAAPPSFNVVGTSGTNQLAQTLNEDQQPIEAFVVSSSITNQQELDNNIEQTASIG